MNETQVFQATVDNLYDGVYVVDRSRRITHWNRAAAAATGYAASEVVGQRCSDDILEHTDEKGAVICNVGCPLAKTLADGEVRNAQAYLHHKRGHRVPVSLRIAPVYDEAGSICAAVQVFSENTKVMAALEQVRELEKLALLDPLTGLPNRRCLEHSLTARFDEMHRYGWPVGVLYADIDRFKQINDTFGHDAGDQVLRMVGLTLAGASRSFDVIGRWGGEEFLDVITRVSVEDLRAIAERKRALVERAFLKTERGKLCVTVSIGAALATREDTEDSLIKAADECMYESKLQGRNRVAVRASAEATVA